MSKLTKEDMKFSKDLNNKFIIEDGCIIIGRCGLHVELVSCEELVKGGGWFHINNEDKIITLQFDSTDYGQAKYEDIKECVDNNKVYDNPFSTTSFTEKYTIDYTWYKDNA